MFVCGQNFIPWVPEIFLARFISIACAGLRPPKRSEVFPSAAREKKTSDTQGKSFSARIALQFVVA